MKTQKSSIQKELQIVSKEIATIPTKIMVADDQGYQIARDQYKVIQQVGKNLTERKKRILDPLNLAISEIKALFLPKETEILELSRAFSSELGRYATEAENARLRALSAINSDKRLKNIETIQTKREEVGDRLTGTMKIKKVVIENELIIPREYLMPDEKKIKAALLEGKKVKGASLVEELIVTSK